MMKKSSSKKVIVEKLNKAENFVKRVIADKYYSGMEKDRLIGKVWEEVNKHLGQDQIGDRRHLPPEYTAAMAKFLNYGK
jgi:hypothetical protein